MQGYRTQEGPGKGEMIVIQRMTERQFVVNIQMNQSGYVRLSRELWVTNVNLLMTMDTHSYPYSKT